MFRDMEDIVETLKTAKAHGKKCSVLVGAGCSVTAGIPTAQGFVERIKKDYPQAYKRAKQKTYPDCMAELPVDERRDLIAEYIDKAKINWGHIALAQLIGAGYIDRVLTTNFDSLVARACALVGRFPASYDLAASQHFEPEKVPDEAIFYLHGQRTGFILLNTEEVLKKHSELLAPVFEDAGRRRVWLVVGYSGENDPVFDHLASVPCFDNNLYWIGYKDDEPAQHVREKLLVGDKDAFYTKGFDADSFFVTLAQKLECFPPDFVGKPFSYLDQLFEILTPYTPLKTSSPVDDVYFARKFVQEAIVSIEDVHIDVLQATKFLYAGEYDKVIELSSKYAGGMHSELAKTIAWAYVMQGYILAEQAKVAISAEADKLFEQAEQKCANALKLKPDMHQALNNWGIVLAAQARTKTGQDVDDLFKLAGKKYEAALTIKPNEHEVLNNWGLALADWAGIKAGQEADDLFKLAGEKYEAALVIKSNYHEAFYNWGNALTARARAKTGQNADGLFKLAGKKYEAALVIKSDYHEALNNWGVALADWARTKTGKKANGLFKLAGKKYEAALVIKSDLHEALNNWGNALASQARTKTGQDADDLFKLAGEKYEAALVITPDKYLALRHWGIALSDWAHTKTGKDADDLFKLAGEKYEAALAIKPDYHEALNNWGIALCDWAHAKTGEDVHDLLKLAGEKYEAKIKPDDYASLSMLGAFLLPQYRVVPDDRKAQIIQQAKDILLRAEKIVPGFAAYNLACACSLGGQEVECQQWLITSKDAGQLPKRAHLEQDTDLDPVRDTPWFKAFLETIE